MYVRPMPEDWLDPKWLRGPRGSFRSGEVKRFVSECEQDQLVFPQLPGVHCWIQHTLGDYRIVDSSDNVLASDTVGSALGLSIKSMSALGSTFTVTTKGQVWRFKRASWPVSEVCASDGVPLFRTVGRHFNGASRGFVELADGRVHRMPVRGIASGHAQMAVLDETGTPYLRLRIAREPCPRASRIEAVAEPDRRITAERLLIIALVSSSLSTFFVRPGG
jgi:hypothetical protein